MTKLFVGSLPYSATSQQLNDLFAAVGKVISATVVTDKFSGQSKGFGFVEMEDDQEAKKAIEQLNDSEFDGRKIFVAVARPREDRPQRNDGFNRGGGFGRNDDRRGGFNRGRDSRGGRR